MTSLSNEMFARDFAIKLTELGIEHGFLEEDHGEYTINNFHKIIGVLDKNNILKSLLTHSELQSGLLKNSFFDKQEDKF